MESSARPHLSEDELHAHADGEFSPSQRAEVAEHLLSCPSCQAEQADVLSLRERTSELLSRAAPRIVHQLPMVPTAVVAQVAPRRRSVRRGSLMAAGLATLAVGTWYALKPDPFAPPPSLATAMVAPLSSLPNGPRNDVVAAVDPIDADPLPEWQPVDLPTAAKVVAGPVPVLDGLPLKAIKIHPSAVGAKPALVARFVLPDGHSVWVIEAVKEELPVVKSLLATNGLAVSIPLETRPDLIVTPDASRPTVRIVTLAAYLPVDSLNALVTKLRMRH